MTAPVAIDVRRATADDLDVLAEAHRLGQAAVANARGGPLDTLLNGRSEPIEESFAADLADATTIVTVGTADSAVVGYCVLEIRDLRNGDKLGVVNDLWVHPDARGIGIGFVLMREASETATANGCCGIDARALPGDRATKNFFESFGLVARAIEVHRSLP